MTPGEREVIKLLRLLCDRLGVVEPVVEKPTSAASVASVAVEFGHVTDHGDRDGDPPSQLEHGVVVVGPMRRYRRVTTIKGDKK